MGPRIVLVLGALLCWNATALHFFTKPTRSIGMRSAHVGGTSFTLHNGKLYRLAPNGALGSVSRWPRISKIAKFGHALVALTYQGELQFWQRAEDGEWRPSTRTTRTFADFSANNETLVAIDRDGHAHAIHLTDAKTPTDLEPVLADLANLRQVTGFSPDRGFALFKEDSTRVLLDAAGSPCARLLGVR